MVSHSENGTAALKEIAHIELTQLGPQEETDSIEKE